MTARQLTLNWEPGLTERFKTLDSVLAAAVYGSRKGLNAVAADLDMSPSELTRRLNPDTDDPRPLRTRDAVAIIKATGDMRPVHWLVETFLRDPEAARAEAIAQIPVVIAQLQDLYATASAKRPGR